MALRVETTPKTPLAGKAQAPICGLVMPISGSDLYPESHWQDVRLILAEAIDSAGFEANLVSNADESGLIHKRIIQNLYDNPLVICDVSSKNPNVMFELGIRLAFDKPTLIVKDSVTGYSFDTSAIEHLPYPRDLRFNQIVEFKQKLTEKIKATHKKASEDKNYTTFLKHFGEFKIAKLEEKEVSGQEFLIEELKSIRLSLAKLESNRLLRSHIENQGLGNVSIGLTFDGTDEQFEEFRRRAFMIVGADRVLQHKSSPDKVGSIQVDFLGIPTSDDTMSKRKSVLHRILSEVQIEIP